MTKDEQEACDRLDELAKELEKLKESRNNNGSHINFFHYLKVERNELIHSRVIANLFDKDQNYNMAYEALKFFLKELCSYKTSNSGLIIDGKTVLTNKEILSGNLCGGIKNETELLDLVPNANCYKVENEWTLNNRANRMDIFIDIPETKTVIVIENKIDTVAHDNQLERYIQEVSGSAYKDYTHKIFVYLSLNAAGGELPMNYGGDELYNENYCILDYSAIERIVKMIIKQKSAIVTPNNRIKTDLLKIMEDYKEVLDVDLLKKSSDLRAKCKDIIKKYNDVIKLINSFNDNIHDVMDYSKGYLKTQGCTLISGKASESFKFYTKTLEDFISKRNNDKYSPQDAYYLCGTDGGHIVGVWLITKANGKPAQTAILGKCAANKRIGILLTWDERSKQFQKGTAGTNVITGGDILTDVELGGKWTKILSDIKNLESIILV